MPRLAIVVAAAVLAAGCRVGDLPDVPVAGGTAEIVYEIEVPARVDWRRTLAGFEVAGVDTEPTPALVGLVERALEELPDELLAVARPRTIYVVSSHERAEPGTGALAIGPDVYLLEGSLADTTTFDVVRLLAHELTHVHQFAALVASTPASSDDPLATTPLVTEFADATGWRRDGDRWRLAEPGGTTRYGATSPVEDMAEAVASVVVGDGATPIDGARVRWIVDHLGASTDALAAGRPWTPAPAVRYEADAALYDADAVPPGRHREVLVYGASAPWRAGVPDELVRRLAARGIRGDLLRVDDDAVERYAGRFHRADGVSFLVEVWNLRNAPGYVDPPDETLLTFVVAWP
ncbi:MAG TPA: DUF4157 domain-containing protein [Actinobacteria bacterium]|nr:DUF4157 domain-containing protein [Actinomycetota bacterium]